MRTKLIVTVGVLMSAAALAGAIMWRRAVGRQASAQPVLGQTIVSPVKGSLIGQKLPSTQAVPSQFPGGITVTLGGEAEMLVTDPSGRRIGSNSLSNKSFAEIPGASAGDDSIDDPNDNSDNPVNIQAKTLEISPAVPGTYTLTVNSATKGAYDLELAAFSPSYQRTHVELKNVQIEAGARHLYLFRADTANGGSLQLFGGFGGEGDAAKNVNRTLSYANPIGSETRLPVGTQLFSLIIFYNSHARFDSFSALLDGNQITNMFHPTPGGFERVDIPVHPGRNLLVLTMLGTSPSAASTDQDRMEFIIP